MWQVLPRRSAQHVVREAGGQRDYGLFAFVVCCVHARV